MLRFLIICRDRWSLGSAVGQHFWIG